MQSWLLSNPEKLSETPVSDYFIFSWLTCYWNNNCYYLLSTSARTEVSMDALTKDILIFKMMFHLTGTNARVMHIREQIQLLSTSWMCSTTCTQLFKYSCLFHHWWEIYSHVCAKLFHSSCFISLASRMNNVSCCRWKIHYTVMDHGPVVKGLPFSAWLTHLSFTQRSCTLQ